MRNNNALIGGLITLAGVAIIKLISLATIGTNEILTHSDTPDDWPKICVTKKDDVSLTTEIYYTKTFMNTVSKLSDDKRDQIKSKIKELTNPNPLIKPYTALYDHTTQPPKNKIQNIVNKIKYDVVHGGDIHDRGEIRRIRHTDTTSKYAYIVTPHMPKDALTTKLDNDKDVTIKMFLVGYGDHKYFGN